VTKKALEGLVSVDGDLPYPVDPRGLDSGVARQSRESTPVARKSLGAQVLPLLDPEPCSSNMLPTYRRRQSTSVPRQGTSRLALWVSGPANPWIPPATSDSEVPEVNLTLRHRQCAIALTGNCSQTHVFLFSQL
jgi:hypothetical protein